MFSRKSPESPKLDDIRTYDPLLREMIEEEKEQYRKISPEESAWRDRFKYLSLCGFTLRNRFDKTWIPPWDRPGGEHLDPEQFEEWLIGQTGVSVLDARQRDGRLVYIKRVDINSVELEIAKLLKDFDTTDKKNHFVPILDIVEPQSVVEEDKEIHPPNSNEAYIVMPFLRAINDPPFETVSDVVDLVDQLLEGLTFMHQKGIAHRDCAFRNVMMDASSLFPEGFHPVARLRDPSGMHSAVQLPRAAGAVRYYFVDFGISTVTPAAYTNPSADLIDDEADNLTGAGSYEQVSEPFIAGYTPVLGIEGLDREVPELSDTVPYDPFKVDIFIVGNLFKTLLYKDFSNVEFLLPLINMMTQQRPDDRPSAAKAQAQWKQIKEGLTPSQVSWRLKARRELWLQSVVLDSWSFGKNIVSWFTDTQG